MSKSYGYCRANKDEAGYIEVPKSFHVPKGKGIRCGNCIFYGKRSCGIVDGVIHPQGCCNLFVPHGFEKEPFTFASGPEIEDMISRAHSKHIKGHTPTKDRPY